MERREGAAGVEWWGAERRAYREGGARRAERREGAAGAEWRGADRRAYREGGARRAERREGSAGAERRGADRLAYREGGREQDGAAGGSSGCGAAGRRVSRREGGRSTVLGPVVRFAFRFVRPDGSSCGVCIGGVGVQWEAKDEPTARRTGRTPDQAQRTKDNERQKAEVLRRQEDRRRLQLARQETRRPICHQARPPRRPGKETISIRMLMVRRC